MLRLPLVLLLVGATSGWAQQVISAHSGVIHYVEGQVTLEGKAIAPKFAEFPVVKNGETLAAEDGRAEVLLTPGVILRIGENSSFKMISNSRSDTQLAILTGSAIVEVGELLPTNAITLTYNDVRMELLKRGMYRVDADENGKFRVFDGEGRVTGGNQTLLAKKGRQVLLGAVLDMNSFDVKETDALMRWAARRGENLATANVSSARSASNLGYLGGYGAYGSGLATGGSWAYNPWYGMFTFMPYGNGMYYSPYFNYPYYSPYNVGYAMPSGTGFTSAFPISTTSPHFSGGGTGGFSPRPSVPLNASSGSVGSSTASRATNTGTFNSGSGSTSSSGFSGGGVSSGSGSGSRGGAASGGSATGGRAR